MSGPSRRWHGRRCSRWRLLVSLPILAFVVVLALAGPILPITDPLASETAQRLRPPEWFGPRAMHPLGTDGLGRDVLSRLIVGARITVVIGLLAVGLATLVGVSLGLLAGYLGGLVEQLIMRLTDFQLSIPTLVLVIALVAAVGPGLTNVIVVLAVSSWVSYARLARAETLSIRERDYVQAARLLGAGDAWVMRRHVLPNIRPSIMVLSTSQIPQVILAEASLSFLGLGIQPPDPTWGNLVADGRDYLSNASWLSAIPGLALAATTLAIILLGDWLAE